VLQSLAIRNLTVFSEAAFSFSPQLNVVIGENGTGKTHLLKAAYSVLAASAEEGRKPNASPPTKVLLQTKIAEKLIAVLRPESLGRLVRRKQGRDRCDLRFAFDEPDLNTIPVNEIHIADSTPISDCLTGTISISFSRSLS